MRCKDIKSLLILGFASLTSLQWTEADGPADFQDPAITSIVRQIKICEARRHRVHLNTRNMNSFVDGDEMLTKTLALKILEQCKKKSRPKGRARGAKSRGKRKALDFDVLPDSKWQFFPVAVTWDDTLYDDTEPEDAVHRQAVLDALRLIEAKTCIRFREVAPDVVIEQNHVIIKRGAACVSSFGKVDTIPQPIFFSDQCFETVGEMLHHFLHTLGIWHEHQRTDRDTYVSIFLNNVKDGERGSFIKLDAPLINDFGLPYDYASVTHYHSTYRSQEGDLTVSPRDPTYINTIGQRAQLSFLDAKLLNLLYDCTNTLCSSPLSCDNDGYQDPNNCRECICPEGFGGSRCDQLQPSSAGCGGELTATGSVQSITPIGYQTPEGYTEDITCVWRIKSENPDKKVKFGFNGDFKVYCVENACHHYVEVRYKEPLFLTGPRSCCDQPALSGITEAESEEVMIIFKSEFGTVDAEERVGFNFTYFIDVDPCETVTCSNGGICNDGNCTCPPGYTGNTCETDIDGCVGSPCENGGTCQDAVDGFTCSCPPGYTGNVCQTDQDDCLSDPCLNNATCLDMMGGYECLCSPAWGGTNCEVADLCSQSPCSNNASCIFSPSLSNGFRCVCTEGFLGILCEIDIDDCSNTPCKNGGTCADQTNSYKCACASGWTGDQCQTDINECVSNPCKNGATCRNGRDEYTCTCRTGFTGVHCETATSPCYWSVPCRNRGTCIPRGHSYSCICKPGFTGRWCHDVDDCRDGPCKNGGTCVDRLNSFLCRCKPGFEGITCEIDGRTPCDPNPCQNGGTCSERGMEHTCDCPTGFRGVKCETTVDSTDPCDPNPCRNGGTCTKFGTGYKCLCKGNLQGNQCEIGSCGGCGGVPGVIYEPCVAEIEPAEYYVRYKMVHRIVQTRKLFGWITRTRSVLTRVSEMTRRREHFCCDSAERLDIMHGQIKCAVLGWSAWGTCAHVGGMCCQQQSYLFGFPEHSRTLTACDMKTRRCSLRDGTCIGGTRTCPKCEPC